MSFSPTAGSFQWAYGWAQRHPLSTCPPLLSVFKHMFSHAGLRHTITPAHGGSGVRVSISNEGAALGLWKKANRKQTNAAGLNGNPSSRRVQRLLFGCLCTFVWVCLPCLPAGIVGGPARHGPPGAVLHSHTRFREIYCDKWEGTHSPAGVRDAVTLGFVSAEEKMCVNEKW